MCRQECRHYQLFPSGGTNILLCPQRFITGGASIPACLPLTACADRNVGTTSHFHLVQHHSCVALRSIIGGASIPACLTLTVCADRNVCLPFQKHVRQTGRHYQIFPFGAATFFFCPLRSNNWWGKHSCLPNFDCVCRQECRHYQICFCGAGANEAIYGSTPHYNTTRCNPMGLPPA